VAFYETKPRNSIQFHLLYPFILKQSKNDRDLVRIDNSIPAKPDATAKDKFERVVDILRNPKSLAFNSERTYPFSEGHSTQPHRNVDGTIASWRIEHIVSRFHDVPYEGNLTMKEMDRAVATDCRSYARISSHHPPALPCLYLKQTVSSLEALSFVIRPSAFQ
jgi:hypothetical protein